MGQEAKATQQQTLAFGIADGSARARRVQLAMAVRDLRLGRKTGDAKDLALLVFDQTGDGLGDAWGASDELILGHAFGPECGGTTLYAIRRALTEAGILSVETTRAEDGELRRRYAVRWEGVYRVRGWQLPAECRGPAENSAGGRNSRGENSRGENSHCENSHCENSRGENSRCEIRPAKKPADSAPYIPAGAGAGARLSSLVFLSSVDVDDIDRQEEIRARAEEIRRAIFAHRPYAKLDTESRRFIATAAAIAASLGGQWSEWIDFAVEVTRKKQADVPCSYLRNTMRNALIEFAGLCNSQEEAGTVMGKLLAAARPIARPIFTRIEQAAEKAGGGT